MTRKKNAHSTTEQVEQETTTRETTMRQRMMERMKKPFVFSRQKIKEFKRDRLIMSLMHDKRTAPPLILEAVKQSSPEIQAKFVAQLVKSIENEDMREQALAQVQDFVEKQESSSK